MGIPDISWAAVMHRGARAAISLVAAAVLVTAIGWWLNATAGVTEEIAASNIAVAAQALAAAIDAPLARFGQLTEDFRPADFAADRLAMTARQIRLQAAVPLASTTFLVNRTGQVVAASVPVSPAEADVRAAKWFQRAAKQQAGGLALQRLDTAWLRAAPTMVLTRTVTDESGHAAGLVGALFRLDDFRALVRPAWLAQGVSSALVTQDGLIAIRSDAAPARSPALPPTPPPAPADAAIAPDLLARLLLAIDALAGRPATLEAAAEVPSIHAAVQTSEAAEVAIRAAWNNPTTAAPGLLLGFGLALCLLLMALPGRSRPARTAAPPATFGADWSVDLDRRGRLVAADGLLPDPVRRGRGRPFVEVLAAAAGAADAALGRIAAAIKGRVRLDGLDIRLRASEAGERLYRLRLAPMPSGGIRGMARDISEEMSTRARAEAAEAEAAALAAQVEATARERDRVLAAVGHDVRTPMNSILGICALLLEEGDLEDAQRGWIERIEASCEALLAMLNGLLEIASGTDSAELQPAEVDVAGLVEEVSGVLAPQAHDKGLEIRTRFDDAVHGSWMVDPTRLRQVLFNLASNAIKYTDTGSVEIRASAITDADGRTSLRLTVSDTGAGIAREERSLIFERFRRGRGDAADGREGLGLGLALCRENASLMGGTLTVESTVGIGSEFTFEFVAERPGPERQGRRFTGRTALVIGFEAVQTRRLASHLERIGVAVETAEDGFLAIGLAERMAARCGAVDAVVVNAGMTGMEPDAFFARLRATVHGRRSAIVAVGPLADGASTADAVLPQCSDGRQVAATVATFLEAVPALECIDPSAPQPGTARILIVEDNKVNQSLLAAALSRRGFTTFVADGGEAAVRLAAAMRFDAILMDLQMPGIDGFEATRRIRAMGGRMASMPVIALTALTGAAVRSRCAEAGITARVVKPVNLDHLTADLWRWIEKGRADAAALSGAGKQAAGSPATGSPGDDITEIWTGVLECMLSDIGFDRTRACVQEFVADATARCARFSELLPGWEAEAIVRICRDIGGRAIDFGAVGLAQALEELADRATRGERDAAARTVRRIEAHVAGIATSMVATLAELARDAGRDDRDAA